MESWTKPCPTSNHWTVRYTLSNHRTLGGTLSNHRRAGQNLVQPFTNCLVFDFFFAVSSELNLIDGWLAMLGHLIISSCELYKLKKTGLPVLKIHSPTGDGRLFVGCMENTRSLTTRKSPPICVRPFYFALTFKPILQF